MCCGVKSLANAPYCPPPYWHSPLPPLPPPVAPALHRFLLGNRRTGHFVVMIFKMIYQDVIPFSIFTSVFVVMFSMIFFLMFEPERSYGAYTKHVVNCFDGVIGNVGVNGFNETNDEFSLWITIIPKFFNVLFTIMCIILLNLLVAMMGDTYGEISQDADLEWQRERAGIIFSIEQNMTDSELAHPDHKYWVDGAFCRTFTYRPYFHLTFTILSLNLLL